MFKVMTRLSSDALTAFVQLPSPRRRCGLHLTTVYLSTSTLVECPGPPRSPARDCNWISQGGTGVAAATLCHISGLLSIGLPSFFVSVSLFLL